MSSVSQPFNPENFNFTKVQIKEVSTDLIISRYFLYLHEDVGETESIQGCSTCKATLEFVDSRLMVNSVED